VGRTRAVAVGAVVAIALVVTGILVFGGGGSPLKFPQAAHFQTASDYVPSIPPQADLGVPIRGIDPGFNGWRGIVMGRELLCTSQRGMKIEVALLRNDHFVAGQTLNATGNFTFGFEWPLLPRDGGPPVAFTLLSSAGSSATVILSVDDTTYAVLPRSC
jgi:hypothetical protein